MKQNMQKQKQQRILKQFAFEKNLLKRVQKIQVSSQGVAHNATEDE